MVDMTLSRGSQVAHIQPRGHAHAAQGETTTLEQVGAGSRGHQNGKKQMKIRLPSALGDAAWRPPSARHKTLVYAPTGSVPVSRASTSCHDAALKWSPNKWPPKPCCDRCAAHVRPRGLRATPVRPPPPMTRSGATSYQPIRSPSPIRMHVRRLRGIFFSQRA